MSRGTEATEATAYDNDVDFATGHGGSGRGQ